MNKPFKDKKGKLRFDLIPPEFDRAFAEVATFGIKKLQENGVKNAERNWEEGLKLLSDHGAALKRHFNDWELGKDFDFESKLHNLKHALWHIGAMVTQIDRGRIDLDDRPSKSYKDLKNNQNELLKGISSNTMLGGGGGTSSWKTTTITTSDGTAQVISNKIRCNKMTVDKLNDK